MGGVPGCARRCWFYAFDLIDVIQQAGYAPTKHQDLATCCQLVRGQVYVGGVVYKHNVILYDHLSCILCIRQYTDKFYCIPCCQTRKEMGFKPKNIISDVSPPSVYIPGPFYSNLSLLPKCCQNRRSLGINAQCAPQLLTTTKKSRKNNISNTNCYLFI